MTGDVDEDSRLRALVREKIRRGIVDGRVPSVIPASERGHVDRAAGGEHRYRRQPRQPRQRSRWTALLEAIIVGDGSQPYQDILEILLATGADPALADASGVTPMSHAQSRGFAGIADTRRRAGG